MATDRAWYWVAAGVLALGLSNAYQDGQFQWAHRLVARSAMVASRTLGKGARLVEAADVVLGHDSPFLARTEAYLQRAEARLACDRLQHAQQQLVEAEQQISEIQIAKAQTELEQFQGRLGSAYMTWGDRFQLCPRTRHITVNSAQNIVVPRVDIPSIEIPSVEIPETSVNIPEIAPMVNVPAVRIPKIVIPRVVVPRITVPQVRVETSNPDSGLF
jgi:hypothetical protein